jgi:hypothetical protein
VEVEEVEKGGRWRVEQGRGGRRVEDGGWRRGGGRWRKAEGEISELTFGGKKITYATSTL